MSITTISSSEFQQNASETMKAANLGPVFIAEKGWPTHVLLSIEEYQRLTIGDQKMSDLLSMPGTEDIEFVIVPSREPAQGADFS
ncbi:type II toxin-antitoxin system Phd/YefM family antitoxin [Rugamonas sp. CCM 8940]|uniref:type II toxin-antitoxin system Phd/YefM family antitoxin n=1 Tax=Rugamonas sp. CCM 8940 TaxID=2765359 RepID=UPI0018F7374E|nr:type II toxin-antitoxin system Phd/YefM family antitoxin [Rugamonas sp. CCM 8940]MBJ7309725.1 type II toxin-antitoxin system Phd/YefM family antitoxin [Rugamonas sp. CCM 8940]